MSSTNKHALKVWVPGVCNCFQPSLIHPRKRTRTPNRITRLRLQRTHHPLLALLPINITTGTTLPRLHLTSPLPSLFPHPLQTSPPLPIIKKPRLTSRRGRRQPRCLRRRKSPSCTGFRRPQNLDPRFAALISQASFCPL